LLCGSERFLIHAFNFWKIFSGPSNSKDCINLDYYTFFVIFFSYHCFCYMLMEIRTWLCCYIVKVSWFGTITLFIHHHFLGKLLTYHNYLVRKRNQYFNQKKYSIDSYIAEQMRKKKCCICF
jgi:hypothetical protein